MGLGRWRGREGSLSVVIGVAGAMRQSKCRIIRKHPDVLQVTRRGRLARPAGARLEIPTAGRRLASGPFVASDVPQGIHTVSWLVTVSSGSRQLHDVELPRTPETEEARAMILQSENGYLLLETGPANVILRAPILGELLVEWTSKAEWQARPPDAPRWEMETRQDVDALRGYRHPVVVLGRYTLTYWPWDVVRKWRLLNRRAAPQNRA